MKTEQAEIIIQRIHLHTLRANGVPKGQPRPRAFVRGTRAAVYDPGTAEGWKSCVAVACREIEGACIHVPLSVTLTFFMPRPKSHYRTSGQLKPAAPRFMHDQKPDADNLAKAVLDALTGIRAWLDDDQVCELVVRKYWESERNGAQTDPPGCAIRITELREVEL
jgi:Holliday junction resolvase RusA-like endonuclease